MVIWNLDDKAVFSHLPALTLFSCSPKVWYWIAVTLGLLQPFQSEGTLHILEGCALQSLKRPEGLTHFGKNSIIRGRVILLGWLKGREVQWGFNYHTGTWSRLPLTALAFALVLSRHEVLMKSSSDYEFPGDHSSNEEDKSS